MTWDQVKRGQVPADFGAIALVREARRNRIATRPQVPVVLSRVSVWSDSNCGWVLALVNCLDRSFPRPEDRIRLDRRAAILPVPRKRVSRICRHVCYEHRWEHWAIRHVGPRLRVAAGNGRPNHWGYFAIRVGVHNRNRVASCGGHGSQPASVFTATLRTPSVMACSSL